VCHCGGHAEERPARFQIAAKPGKTRKNENIETKKNGKMRRKVSVQRKNKNTNNKVMHRGRLVENSERKREERGRERGRERERERERDKASFLPV
jgi:hypothetical protein